MSDVFSRSKRSWVMSRVKSRDTTPEKIVRSLIHSFGFRFRLHRKDLPGIPDIVFPSRRKIIFVHGCFWHGHSCKRGARNPKSNRKYWLNKIHKNKSRDKSHISELHHLGWDVLIIWECQIKEIDKLKCQILLFLKD